MQTSTFPTLAVRQGFSFIDGDCVPELTSFLQTARKDVRRRTRRGFFKQLALNAAVRRIRAASASTDAAIRETYDREYAGDAPYGYASAMLSKYGFDLITGIRGDKTKLRVIDIGAGSNEFLRFCRDTLMIPSGQLHGTDVSPRSRDIIIRDGFTGYAGRLEDLDIPKKSFDLAYLSYFIDYDTDQKATFTAALELVRSGGKIVLEGWFPVRPFALLEKDHDTFAFVTKGRSAEEDVCLVADSFHMLGKDIGREVRLTQVLRTHRFVQSHYGFNELPSFFLTFSVK